MSLTENSVIWQTLNFITKALYCSFPIFNIRKFSRNLHSRDWQCCWWHSGLVVIDDVILTPASRLWRDTMQLNRTPGLGLITYQTIRASMFEFCELIVSKMVTIVCILFYLLLWVCLCSLCTLLLVPLHCMHCARHNFAVSSTHYYARSSANMYTVSTRFSDEFLCRAMQRENTWPEKSMEV